MTSAVEAANALLERLETSARLVRTWHRAVTGAEAMRTDGYPTNTMSGPASATGTHTDPTRDAALAGERTDADRTHGELVDAEQALLKASKFFDQVVKAAVAAGYTDAPASRCSKCGRPPTRVIEGKQPLVNGVCLHCRCVECDTVPSNTGMDRLVNGVCIAHRCVDCGHHPTGKGNDRLRRRRCRRCYRLWLKTQENEDA